MSFLRTLLGIEDARESAAVMRDAYAQCGIEHETSPWEEVVTEGAILDSIAQHGPQTSRHLRMGGPSGVIGTSEAITRLAEAGRIAADEDGRWYITEGGAQ